MSPTNSKPSTLDQIIAWKREEVQVAKSRVPISVLEERCKVVQPKQSLRDAIRSRSRPSPSQAAQVALIAEVKGASPSAGVIREDLNGVELATCYAENGASAISVLTDHRFFNGTLENLSAIRDRVKVPLLRKDFIVDGYQIVESRSAGADVILLIVAALTENALKTLYDEAHSLGLEVLVEVHDQTELERAFAALGTIEIIGINSRDLRTFTVDLSTCERLISMIPSTALVVAESGIRTVADVQRMARVGADAVLVGERLVRAIDTGRTVREFSQQNRSVCERY